MEAVKGAIWLMARVAGAVFGAMLVVVFSLIGLVMGALPIAVAIVIALYFIRSFV